jgi:lysozyme family protein
MARLPDSLDVGAPRGARLSGDTVRPTDFGLGDVAGAVEQVGQALANRDDRDAEKVIAVPQREFELRMAEEAAAYDGAEPGWATKALASFDNHFTAVSEDTTYSQGLRFALRRKLDAYKADFGRRALGVEAGKRAGIVADQERGKTQGKLSEGEIAFDGDFQPRRQARYDSFNGDDPEFMAGITADYDAAAKAQLDAAEPAVRPALEARLNARKVSALAEAMQFQQTTQAKVVQAATDRGVQALANMVSTNPTSYADATGTLQGLASRLPRALQGPFVQEAKGTLATYRVLGLIQRGDYQQAQQELADGRYDAVMPPAEKVRLGEAVRTRSARLAADLIEALRYGEDVDPVALRTAARDSGDPGLIGKADWALTVGAFEGEALGELGGGGSKKGFAEAADFTIMLEGGDATVLNDNGRGASRFGINQAANPDLDVKNLTRAGAVSRYRKYWNEVGGSSLPPGLAIAAFDAAVLFGPDKPRAWMAEAQGDVGQFLALEQAEMKRLAKADPGKYGDDLKGWLNRVEKVRTEAARRQAFANVQDGVSTDPIKFALGGNGRAALAQVPPLPQEPDGPAFRAALQGRLEVGTMMNRQYRAPLRLLTDGEASQYRDMVQRNPQAGLDLAEEALAAVGPAGAKALMVEIGRQGDASLHVHLADLAAHGSTSFARLAVAGLALKGDKGLEPDSKARVNDALGGFDPATAGLPELSNLVRQTAEAAMLADQGRHPAAYYVQGAFGATTQGGRVFGGVAKVNGRETLLPAWLAQDHADDAMEQLAAGWSAAKQGPVHGDGTRYTQRELERARLVLMPNGNYRLLDGRGQFMVGANRTRAFELDLDASRENLRAVLGAKAVKAGR